MCILVHLVPRMQWVYIKSLSIFKHAELLKSQRVVCLLTKTGTPNSTVNTVTLNTIRLPSTPYSIHSTPYGYSHCYMVTFNAFGFPQTPYSNLQCHSYSHCYMVNFNACGYPQHQIVTFNTTRLPSTLYGYLQYNMLAFNTIATLNTLRLLNTIQFTLNTMWLLPKWKKNNYTYILKMKQISFQIIFVFTLYHLYM